MPTLHLPSSPSPTAVASGSSDTTTSKCPQCNKPRLLRLFSRTVAPTSAREKHDDLVEPTWRSEEEEEDSGDLAAGHWHVAPAVPLSSILKYKTQKESLSKPYPKPFLRPGCHHCQQKRVGFSSVRIRGYGTILSDHPCTLVGPPVGLGWQVLKEETKTVAQQFTSNPWRGQSRPKDFRLSRWTRERMLLTRGYSREQLLEAEQEAAMIRASRQKNAVGYPVWMRPLLVKIGLVPKHLVRAAQTDNTLKAALVVAPQGVGRYTSGTRKEKKKKKRMGQLATKQEQDG